MDYRLFGLVNGLADKFRLLDLIGIFFAEYYLYILAAAVALLWFNKSLRRHVYLAIFNAAIARLVIVELIKRLVDRPRPYEVIPVRQLIVDNETGNSFPSGHTVFYFAIAFSFYGTRLFWPMVVLATIGSVARVFVGVHYPTDVLFSVVVAGIVSFSSWYILSKRETKKVS